MSKHQASAILLTLRGFIVLTLALVDWLTAKLNVSRRNYLIPTRVAREFGEAIRAVWHGQNRPPSLLACTHWNHNAGGKEPR
jgi:hypothetical protein